MLRWHSEPILHVFIVDLCAVGQSSSLPSLVLELRSP